MQRRHSILTLSLLAISLGLTISPPWACANDSDCIESYRRLANDRVSLVEMTGDAPVEIKEALSAKVSDAILYFAEHIQPISGPLKVEAGGSGYRTGYDFKSGTLSFPNLAKIDSDGSKSDDVVFHESFHAMLCRIKPQACSEAALKKSEVTILHEAFADLFAYFAHPDASFGENFELAHAYLRLYRTPLVFGLVEGEHGKANALVSILLKNGYSIESMKKFIQEGEFSLSGLAQSDPAIAKQIAEEASKTASVTPVNYPPSDLYRYRVSPDSPLKLAVSPSDSLKTAVPDLQVKVVTEEGAAIPEASVKFNTETREYEVTIPVKEGTSARKLLISYWSGEQPLGAKPIYVGPKSLKGQVQP